MQSHSHEIVRAWQWATPPRSSGHALKMLCALLWPHSPGVSSRGCVYPVLCGPNSTAQHCSSGKTVSLVFFSCERAGSPFKALLHEGDIEESLPTGLFEGAVGCTACPPQQLMQETSCRAEAKSLRVSRSVDSSGRITAQTVRDMTLSDRKGHDSGQARSLLTLGLQWAYGHGKLD